jgi:hypothetical protein
LTELANTICLEAFLQPAVEVVELQIAFSLPGFLGLLALTGKGLRIR